MIPIGSNSRLKSILSYGLAGCSIAALLIYLVVIGGNTEADQLMQFVDTDFRFHVYCPIDSSSVYQYYQQYFGGKKQKMQSPNSDSFYVVYMQARNIQTTTINATTNTAHTTSQMGLYYCGLARQWNGTCQDAQMICSAPGPMFYLPVDEEVKIMWINNVSSDGINWIQQGCYDSKTTAEQCMIDAKFLPQNNPSQQGCTFNSPTNYSFSSRKVRVSKDQFPVSPHIHGLETRPAFDGNPLSWFNNVGDKGVGYQSLNNTQYFYSFSEVDSFLQVPSYNQVKNMKIISARNKQLPGNLFYHDHAMKSTKFNVGYGLSGLYILYNQTAEANLPTGQQEMFILFSHANDGDLRNMTTFANSHTVDHPDKIFLNCEDTFTYHRNMTYRFRVLNGHYDNIYHNVSLVTYYKNNGYGAQEIDPMNLAYPLTANMHKINFTVIGTDSALFNNPVHNVNTFDLGVAERVEFLAKFDEMNEVPANIQHFYLVCFDGVADSYVIKQKFVLDDIPTENKYNDPIETDPLPLPFTDLSIIPKQSIAVNRMRALFSRPAEKNFVINGHYMFDMGASDLPQIGTVEDWYIINNLWQPHPMHLHLVNFQIIKTYDLKLTAQGCAIYELDFFRFSNYSSFKGLNNAQLCHYLGNITENEASKLYHYLGTYSLETSILQSNIGPVSGLNVMETIIPGQDNVYILPNSQCPLNSIYKYICKQTSSERPAWYRRWKQTALVNKYSVSVLRVRWTSTLYDQSFLNAPYFAHPEDQMIEFPGFVYHCHILPHQDNEMMRPFMLTPSKRYLNSKTSTTLTNVQNSQNNLRNQFSKIPMKLPTINQAKPDFWYENAVKINRRLQCPA